MSEELKSKISENGKILLSKDAFRNIITHVLRFGSEILENSQPVMGLCLGKLTENGKDIAITNAIPISHGEQIEEEFSDDLKIIIEQIDEKYKEKDLSVYGWYHSHIDLGLFYSTSDLKNQEFFQLKEGPFDFGIVMDPTKIKPGSNLGFKVFQLSDKDPDGYIEKAYELEKPNNLEVFKWVQKFVEDFHKKNPTLIKEVSESKEKTSMELDEIPRVLDTYEEDIFNEELFQEGLDSYTETLKVILSDDIGFWMNDVASGAIEGSKKLKESSESFKESIPLGISKIKRWFKQKSEDLTNNFKSSISNYVENRIKSEKDLINKFTETLNELKTNQQEIVNKNISEILNQNQKKTVEITKRIKQIKDFTLNLKKLINTLDLNVDDFSNNLSNHLETELGKKLEKDHTEIKNTMSNSAKDSTEELDKMEKSQSEIFDLIKKLQEMIITIRNL